MQSQHTPVSTTYRGSRSTLIRRLPLSTSKLSDKGNTVVVYKCHIPGCGKQFSRKYTLTEHVKTHTGEKPHVCTIRGCGKRFSTSGNLSRHQRLHGPILPIPCPVEGCICTFTNENRLKKHMVFHFGNPSHVCLILGCGKTFSTVGNLNRHLKNQHTLYDRRQLHDMSFISMNSTHFLANLAVQSIMESPINSTDTPFVMYSGSVDNTPKDWTTSPWSATVEPFHTETEPWTPEAVHMLMSILQD